MKKILIISSIVVVIMIIIYVIIKKNKKSETSNSGPSNSGPSNSGTPFYGEPDEDPLIKLRQQEVESVATALYKSIYVSHDDKAYDRALSLTDTELKYMSRFYRIRITQGTWLYTDIDNEIFSPWNDRDKRLMAKLAIIGEKG